LFTSRRLEPDVANGALLLEAAALFVAGVFFADFFLLDVLLDVFFIVYAFLSEEKCSFFLPLAMHRNLSADCVTRAQPAFCLLSSSLRHFR
jgi:hypothetical protein